MSLKSILQTIGKKIVSCVYIESVLDDEYYTYYLRKEDTEF